MSSALLQHCDDPSAADVAEGRDLRTVLLGEGLVDGETDVTGAAGRGFTEERSADEETLNSPIITK